MAIRSATPIIVLLFIICGCTAVQDFGSSVKYNIQGEYYLEEKQFEKGRREFIEAIRRDPHNPEAHFYYGRFLLAEGEAAQALSSLAKAVDLKPDNSDYAFWLGVAYGETGQPQKERTFYRRALSHEEDHLQALTYLGNNLLRAKEYERALRYYQKTLDIWPQSPQALYNRGTILRKLQRMPEEKLAWRHYLWAYPSGSFARHAAERLNWYGDHSYRNYQLGNRTVTLAEISFIPFKPALARQALPSLDIVGAVATNLGRGNLHVLVHQLNNEELAKKRALSIREYLYQNFPQLKERDAIRLSWFDVEEKRRVLGKTVTLGESVRFFITDL